MGRRDSPLVEISRDLAQRPPGSTLGSDLVDDVRLEDSRPSSLARRCPCANRGTKLAFATNRSPGGGFNFNIYTMNSNGSSQQSLVLHGAADVFPDW